MLITIPVISIIRATVNWAIMWCVDRRNNIRKVSKKYHAIIAISRIIDMLL